MAPLTPGAFSHVGATVPDLPAAVAWYTETLGMYLLAGPIEVVEDDSEIGLAAAAVYGKGFSRFSFAHLAFPDGVGLELFNFANPPTQVRGDNFEYWMTGINHFAVTVRDTAAMAAVIAAAGGRIRHEPVVLDQRKGYTIQYCEDPWGTVIELCSHPYAQMWGGVG